MDRQEPPYVACPIFATMTHKSIFTDGVDPYKISRIVTTNMARSSSSQDVRASFLLGGAHVNL